MDRTRRDTVGLASQVGGGWKEPSSALDGAQGGPVGLSTSQLLGNQGSALLVWHRSRRHPAGRARGRWEQHTFQVGKDRGWLCF